MPNVWVTSDSHWSHWNIVKGCSNWEDKTGCRDFNTVEEHDEYLLTKLNDKVRSSDILWHLGDVGFGFRWKEKIKEFRRRINCETINLILGNHDHLIENAKPGDPIRSLFNKVEKLWYGKLVGQAVVLCHYKMAVWPWREQSSFLLFGHSHSNYPENKEEYSLDVGVDTKLYGHEQYTPYSMEEIIHIMKTYKTYIPFSRHNRKEEEK